MHTIFYEKCFTYMIIDKTWHQVLKIKKGLSYESPLESGGDEWIRTTDSRIFSPMLYQLSYITSKSGCKSR